MSVAGGVIGAVSALVGIGGGTLTVPFLVWHRVEMVKAVGTSSACGSAHRRGRGPGFRGRGMGRGRLAAGATGYLYWPALGGVVAASVLTAPVGAWLAHKLPVAVLKRVVRGAVAGCRREAVAELSLKEYPTANERE